MPKPRHFSATPATQMLKKHNIVFGEHTYDYVDHGGAQEAAKQLGLDLHSVAKTLIMEDELGHPMIVLMHGDCDVSTKSLARQIGAKRVSPCAPETAQKHSGYLVGGTSPFATRRIMPIWMEESLLRLPILYVNGGHRGYLISVPPAVLSDLLNVKPIQVGRTKK